MPPRGRRHPRAEAYLRAYNRLVRYGFITISQAVTELTTLPFRLLRTRSRVHRRVRNRIRPPRDWKLDVPRPPGLLIDYDEIPHMGFDPWKANTRMDCHIYYREDDNRFRPTEWSGSNRSNDWMDDD